MPNPHRYSGYRKRSVSDIHVGCASKRCNFHFTNVVTHDVFRSLVVLVMAI